MVILQCPECKSVKVRLGGMYEVECLICGYEGYAENFLLKEVAIDEH